MPHKGNGAMFIQLFISEGNSSTQNPQRLGFSQAFLGGKRWEGLKDLQVHPKVPSHRLLRLQFLQYRQWVLMF